jgi:hypothetical protein
MVDEARERSLATDTLLALLIAVIAMFCLYVVVVRTLHCRLMQCHYGG